MNLDGETLFKRRADVRYRNIGGEGVVVKQTIGEVLVVSEVGARILDLLEAAIPVPHLLATLEAEFDTDRATLEHDVLAYLQEMLDAEVIEPVKI